MSISAIEDHELRISQLAKKLGRNLQEHLKKHQLTLLDTKDLASEVVLALRQALLAHALPAVVLGLYGETYLTLALKLTRAKSMRGFSFLFLFISIDMPNYDICADIFTLLASHKSTPPTVYDQLPLDTPFKSTSSQRANEQYMTTSTRAYFKRSTGAYIGTQEASTINAFEAKEWSAEVERIA